MLGSLLTLALVELLLRLLRSVLCLRYTCTAVLPCRALTCLTWDT